MKPERLVSPCDSKEASNESVLTIRRRCAGSRLLCPHRGIREQTECAVNVKETRLCHQAFLQVPGLFLLQVYGVNVNP